MTLLTAVPYRRFIEILFLLDVYIPWLPSEPEKPFLIFRSSGTGYMGPTGSGPRAPFISRDNDEMVPAFELEKTLGLLNLPAEIFLSTLSRCQVDNTNAVTDSNHGA